MNMFFIHYISTERAWNHYSRALLFFIIDSKVLSLLLELLHFQETHHRFHQCDRLRRFFERTIIWLASVWMNSWSWLAKIIDSFKILQSIIQTWNRLQIQVIGWIIQYKNIWLEEHQFRQHDTNFFSSWQDVDRLVNFVTRKEHTS